MKTRRFSARMFFVCLVLLFTLNPAVAQEVKLNAVPLQQVLDQLFGTPANPGLLHGEHHFDLRAEGITLTGDQARNFFVPTSANTADIADLISAAEQTKGAQVRIEGLLDGAPFEFKLAGKEIKLEGLNLTQAELTSLVDQLKAIPGLHEAKIQGLVDGKPMVVKLENRSGHVKIEDRDHRLGGKDHERFEKQEKVEHAEKIERIERPETEHGGSGRH